MTIKTLLDLCAREVAKGNGDKQILVPDDEEGNGYHELENSLINADKFIKECGGDDWACGYISDCFAKNKTAKDYVILG